MIDCQEHIKRSKQVDQNLMVICGRRLDAKYTDGEIDFIKQSCKYIISAIGSTNKPQNSSSQSRRRQEDPKDIFVQHFIRGAIDYPQYKDFYYVLLDLYDINVTDYSYESILKIQNNVNNRTNNFEVLYVKII